MSKKRLLILLVPLLVLGIGYMTVAKSNTTVKRKIAGTIYVMPKRSC